MPPADMTDQFNTQLSPQEEQQFQSWAQGNRRMGDLFDYDMRGWWRENRGKDMGMMPYEAQGEEHLTDQYKKPNHPTFSSDSQYHNGKDLVGGSWSKDPQGTWEFRPAQTNMEHYAPQELQQYFSRSDPSSRLVFEGY